MSSKQRKGKKEERYILALVLFLLGVFLFLSLAHRIFVVVPAGHSGVLWRLHGGTVLDHTYSEGLHILAPWNELALYNTRLRTETRQVSAQTQGGLTIHASVTFRYRPRPEQLPYLHRMVGQDYLDQYVVPKLGFLVSSLIAEKNHQSIYGERRGMAEALTDQIAKEGALASLPAQGESEQLVDIPEIFVNEVVLPEEVDKVVQAKFAKMERLEGAEYDRKLVSLENELMEMEGRGVATFQRIVGSGLQSYLTWKSIEATSDVAKSENAKVVVVSPGHKAPVLINSGD